MASTMPGFDALVERPIFQYLPLTEPDATRLILLQPSKDVTAELECSIEHATLSQCKQDLINQYTDLSYVWGNANDKRQIVVDGCSFHVTANLDSALRHIRDDKAIIKIWADAICIYQTDIDERNQQVQQMGTVYSVARHTIINLGEASTATDWILTELGSLSTGNRTPSSAKHMYSKYSDGELEELHGAIKAHIVQKPWFGRLWVFQEVLLSRDPWMQCGSKHLRWDDLCQFSFLDAQESRKQQNEFAYDYGYKPKIDRIPKRPVGKLAPIKNMHMARQKFEAYASGDGEGNTLVHCCK